MLQKRKARGKSARNSVSLVCNDITAGGFLHHCRWQHQWQLGPGVRLNVSSEEPPEGPCETTSQSPRETTSPAMKRERGGEEGRGRMRPERERKREREGRREGRRNILL